jgi:meso-butanediol dehydrogenase / (S,S)-butanediol dehydrogenase / diacetyl reductase
LSDLWTDGSPLAGQGAVVTGAARGIGLGIARELLRAGARVVLADVNRESVQAAASGLGEGTYAEVVDVTDPGSVEGLRDAAVRELGRVSVLVNNAGVLSVAPVLEMHVGEWDRVMAVNARGVFLCSRAFGRHMVDSGGGSIINMASIAGKRGDPTLAHYAASKFAVVGFTQSLAMELAEHGVRVNAVCPGAVATPMLEGLADEWHTSVSAMARNGQLIKSPQDVREIGAAVVFLATMPSVTGQAINVDGGSVFN